MRILLSMLILTVPAIAADVDFNGRWNLKAEKEPRGRAWWLEVTGAGTPKMKGRFVGAPGGDMNDIPEMSIKNGDLEWVFTKQYRGAKAGSVRGIYRARLAGKDILIGTHTVEGDASKTLAFAGKRAPVITDTDDGKWKEGTPVHLFNGKDLAGWLPLVKGQPLGWAVHDGAMANVAGANNMVSADTFWNFKIHAEFKVGEQSNSGLGLRGRYEVQILEDLGKPPDTHSCGALYSRVKPAVNASKPAGEWQSFDVTLIGRTLTVVHNGKTVLDNVNIDGLTAMASDPNEDQPGPIVLQGDHGAVEFRKLTLTPLVR